MPVQQTTCGGELSADGKEFRSTSGVLWKKTLFGEWGAYQLTLAQRDLEIDRLGELGMQSRLSRIKVGEAYEYEVRMHGKGTPFKLSE